MGETVRPRRSMATHSRGEWPRSTVMTRRCSARDAGSGYTAETDRRSGEQLMMKRRWCGLAQGGDWPSTGVWEQCGRCGLTLLERRLIVDPGDQRAAGGSFKILYYTNIVLPEDPTSDTTVVRRAAGVSSVKIPFITSPVYLWISLNTIHNN